MILVLLQKKKTCGNIYYCKYKFFTQLNSFHANRFLVFSFVHFFQFFSFQFLTKIRNVFMNNVQNLITNYV